MAERPSSKTALGEKVARFAKLFGWRSGSRNRRWDGERWRSSRPLSLSRPHHPLCHLQHDLPGHKAIAGGEEAVPCT